MWIIDKGAIGLGGVKGAIVEGLMHATAVPHQIAQKASAIIISDLGAVRHRALVACGIICKFNPAGCEKVPMGGGVQGLAKPGLKSFKQIRKADKHRIMPRGLASDSPRRWVAALHGQPLPTLQAPFGGLGQKAVDFIWAGF